jgi:hypothetical protein
MVDLPSAALRALVDQHHQPGNAFTAPTDYGTGVEHGLACICGADWAEDAGNDGCAERLTLLAIADEIDEEFRGLRGINQLLTQRVRVITSTKDQWRAQVAEEIALAIENAARGENKLAEDAKLPQSSRAIAAWSAATYWTAADIARRHTVAEPSAVEERQ